MIKVISCGDCVEVGTYSKHSQFSKAINYRRVDQNREYLLSVVLPEVGAGPYNIEVENFSFFESDLLEIDQTFLQANIYDSKLEGIKSIKKNNVDLLKKLILENYYDRSKISFLLKDDLAVGQSLGNSFDEAFENHFRSGVEMLFSGDFREGVRKIRGVGIGLTPTGDDYLCGMMFGLHLINLNSRSDEIYSIAIGENLISNSALYAAKCGRATRALKALLVAMTEEKEDTIKRSLNVVANIGNSSGVDMLIGLVMVPNSKEFMNQVRF